LSRFRFDFTLLKQALRQMRPLVYGAMYYRTNFIVDRLLASFLAPGSIVILDLAQRIQAAIVRVLNQGIVTPVIPRLAKLAEAGNWEGFRTLYRRKSLEMLLMNCGLVTMVGFVLVAHPKLGTTLPAAHFMGNLTPDAVNRLLAVFLYMSGVMLGGSLNHTLMNSYYAARNTVTPTQIGVATYTLGIGMKLAGFFFLGLTGIALAISISTLVQTVLLYGYLRPQRLAPFNQLQQTSAEAAQGRTGWHFPEPALPKARERAADL
jgi:putative peptidoglycan lipid II flippase